MKSKYIKRFIVFMTLSLGLISTAGIRVETEQEHLSKPTVEQQEFMFQQDFNKSLNSLVEVVQKLKKYEQIP